MNESDQLQDDCEKLIARSRTLLDRSMRLLSVGGAQTAQLAQMHARRQVALAEAQRVLRRNPTGWLPPTRDGD
jgi:hypothetical protein